MKTPLWKISLVVWLPVIIAGVIYGIIYLSHYEHAKHTYSYYQKQYNSCEAIEMQNNAKETAGIHYRSTALGQEPYKTYIAPPMSCQTPGQINSDFLGFPSYSF